MIRGEFFSIELVYVVESIILVVVVWKKHQKRRSLVYMALVLVLVVACGAGDISAIGACWRRGGGVH